MVERASAPGAERLVATSVRGRIPAMDRGDAEIACRLFDRARAWPLRDGAALRFAHARASIGEEVALDADGATCAVAFDPEVALHRDDGLRWSDHVGRSRTLAWALAHEAALVRLGEALGAALVPRVEPAEPGGGELHFAFAIDGPATEAPVRGILRMPSAWIDRLLARAVDDPAVDAISMARVDALPVALRVAWPGPRLARAQWRALRPGDVLVLGARASAERAEARGAGRAWPLARAADGWRIDGPPFPLPDLLQEPRMETSPEPTPPAEAAPDVPVRVEFQIGGAELTVQRLAQLQPGYVFALPTALEGANVVIRANGREAARGELVAVGDTLGVRLLAWS